MNRLDIAFYIFSLIILVSCEGKEDFDVAYSVTGTDKLAVNISYMDEYGNLLLRDNVRIPWNFSFIGQKGDMVYLSAEKLSSLGTVKVIIYKNSSIWKESTTIEPYGVASEIGEL